MIKDLILFAVGILLIVRQGFVVPAQDFNLWAMGFGGVLAGVPGWLQIWGRTSTGGPSSPDPAPPSPLPSSPPSSSA